MACNVAGKSFINWICIYIFISCSTAVSQGSLIVKYYSNNCSAVVAANGGVAQIEAVHNASMRMLLVSDTLGYEKSLSMSECNIMSLEIQLIDSNMSVSLNQNSVRISAVKLSASTVKLQNGTYVFEGSVLVPESSVIELDCATLATTPDSKQILLTIKGTLIVCECLSKHLVLSLSMLCSLQISGGFHVHKSHLDMDTLISTSSNVMVANKIVIPRGRSWTFESRVSMLLQASTTTSPWTLVVDGELKISFVADVIFSQGRVIISPEGALLLEGIAVFEALTLGLEYPSNGTMQKSSNRICVKGSGTFGTLLRSKVNYEAARFEIFCDFSPNVHFIFVQSNQRYFPSRFKDTDFDPQGPFLSTELILLVGLQSFTANFESTNYKNIFGFVVTIQNADREATLDVHVKKLDATNLNLVGQIRISCDDCYAHRLRIMGSGTGVFLKRGGTSRHLKFSHVPSCFGIGTLNCTMVQLENHLFVDGELSIRGNERFNVPFYETGIVQPESTSFVTNIRPGATVTLRILNEGNKGIRIGTNVRIHGLLRAAGTHLQLERSVLMLDGPLAEFDVSSAEVRSVDDQQSTSLINVSQGTMCGPFGKIQVPILTESASRCTVSPSCNEMDYFPSTLFLQGNFSATLRTRIRNKACDIIKMTNSDQQFGSYNSKVLVSSAMFDDDFQKHKTIWQVYEGVTFISNKSDADGEEIPYNSVTSSLRMGQFSNASGVFIYSCAANFSGGCTLCGPGTMMFGTNCIECESGYFSDSGLPHSCKVCAPGYFSNVAGSSKCKACLPGYIRNTTMNADQCLPCPAGKILHRNQPPSISHISDQDS